jgi:hypothetical protein
MDILKLLGFKKATNSDAPYPYKDILHLWEDDYLMLELLPNENLEFIKNETKRINNFGQENFDSNGFTDITTISEKPANTIEKLIDITEIENIILKSGLEKITQFHMQGVGLLQGDKALLGFGTNNFAVMLDKDGKLLKNIWLTGSTRTEKESKILADTLLSIGQEYNFIAVNWFKGNFYNLVERQSVEEFIKNSC